MKSEDEEANLEILEILQMKKGLPPLEVEKPNLEILETKEVISPPEQVSTEQSPEQVSAEQSTGETELEIKQVASSPEQVSTEQSIDETEAVMVSPVQTELSESTNI